MNEIDEPVVCPFCLSRNIDTSESEIGETNVKDDVLVKCQRCESIDRLYRFKRFTKWSVSKAWFPPDFDKPRMMAPSITLGATVYNKYRVNNWSQERWCADILAIKEETMVAATVPFGSVFVPRILPPKIFMLKIDITNDCDAEWMKDKPAGFRVFESLFFNRQETTHCAEMTASYCCYFHEHQWDCRDFDALDNAEIDRIDEEVITMESNAVQYIHCHVLDNAEKIPENQSFPPRGTLMGVREIEILTPETFWAMVEDFEYDYDEFSTALYEGTLEYMNQHGV